jgi:phage gpG-like protein
VAIGLALKAKGLKEAKAMTQRVRKNIDRVLMEAAEAGAVEAVRFIKQERLSGDPIKVRTGHLRRSIRHKLFPRDLKAVVGTNVIYAETLEEGDTITPKRARLLTIPMPAVMTPAGVARGSAREVTKNYRDSWWEKSESGTPILWGLKTDASRKPIPLFWGAKKVTIKGRHFFRDALEHVRPGVLKDAKKRMDIMLDKESDRAK